MQDRNETDLLGSNFLAAFAWAQFAGKHILPTFRRSRSLLHGYGGASASQALTPTEIEGIGAARHGSSEESAS